MIQKVVVMGVAGSGKTTVGSLLAIKLGWRFVDGDDVHPESNVQKMASGVPLTDEDRYGWLQRLAAEIAKPEPIVVACSALKEKYRSQLAGDSQVLFVHLEGSKELLTQRLKARSGHFMKPEMLESQFADLEEPVNALCLDISHTPEELVREVLDRVGQPWK